jgi:hypothetical protein
MTGNAITTLVNSTDHQQTWENALAEAKDYLAATVSAVHPDLSARSLLRYANEYRAHLATLVAACTDLATEAVPAPLPPACNQAI